MKPVFSTLAWHSLIFLCSLLPVNLSAQNALDFDGINDQVSALNASSLITNGNISMALWVYPTNPAAGWPDFDGIAGFRNDINADFYMLQLSSTNIEVRLRNSNGTNYNINSSTLVLNTWNHYVATYDGNFLRLYHNGMLTDSVFATGFIQSGTEGFNIGWTPFSSNNFYLDGRVDDVGLWNRAISASEVNSLYNACLIDPNSPGLQLCYQFNQGVGGGNNSSISQVTDSKGNINGTMNGFGLNGNTSNFVTYGNPTVSTLNDTATCSYTSPTGNHVWTSTGTYFDTLANAAGCDSIIRINLYLTPPNTMTLSPSTCGPYTSPTGNHVWDSTGVYADTVQSSQGCDSLIYTINLTVNQASFDTLTESVCDQYLSPSGNYVWNTTGTYQDTVLNQAGCDSLITIDLTVTTLDTTVSLSGNTLTSNDPSASYQWLDCDNNFAAISGATSASFTPAVNGNYAVAVSNNGCTDTSACTVVIVVSREQLSQNLPVKLYPNPHADRFVIGLPMVFPSLTLRAVDPTGRQVWAQSFSNQQEIEVEWDVAEGLYFIYLEADGFRKVMKVVKRRN